MERELGSMPASLSIVISWCVAILARNEKAQLYQEYCRGCLNKETL